VGGGGWGDCVALLVGSTVFAFQERVKGRGLKDGVASLKSPAGSAFRERVKGKEQKDDQALRTSSTRPVYRRGADGGSGVGLAWCCWVDATLSSDLTRRFCSAETLT
jgi:hypothetical protein